MEPADESGHPRRGGDVVLEALWACGARAVVGLPGQHALGLFDALRRSQLAYLSSRVENNAGFMADGLARTTGSVTPLLLSTGPGALTSLAALQEAAASSVPVLAISAQVPKAGLGGGRHGYLHELPDQAASFRGVVKHTFTVRAVEQISSAVLQSYDITQASPAGPVLLEIPQDVLLETVDERVTVPAFDPPIARRPHPDPGAIALAASWLSESAKPVILAGGGVSRARARDAMTQLSEKLDAPVFTTFGGKDAFPTDHPLAAGSWLEDIAVTEFLEAADVLLVVGSGLGELSSNYHVFRPQGRMIQIEADLGKIAANHRCLPIHSDADTALRALADSVQPRPRTPETMSEVTRVNRVVQDRLDGQDLTHERTLVSQLRAAVPAATDTFWDMTILAYWAWSAWDPRSGIFASAQGAGGLGYGLPAAMGSAFARQVAGDTAGTLAVSGDGGALYGIAELATLAQHDLNVTWLIVDDGGYGILREYMTAVFGESTATELARPDYERLASSFGIRAQSVTTAQLGAAVAEAMSRPGPDVLVLRTHLDMFAPTHLHRLHQGAAADGTS